MVHVFSTISMCFACEWNLYLDAYPVSLIRRSNSGCTAPDLEIKNHLSRNGTLLSGCGGLSMLSQRSLKLERTKHRLRAWTTKTQ